MPDTIRYSNEPSPEVLAYFRNKGVALTFDWRDIWPQEHAHAFTVAKATQIEVLETIRAAIDEAIVKGVPFKQFQATLEPRLKALGWWGRQPMLDPMTGETVLAQLGSPHRLRIIYDANIRTANAAGSWQRIQRAKDILPFLIYQRTSSVEPREEHLTWADKPVVLLVDDPWWETHFPPNGWQCKCSVLQVDEVAARAAGWTPGTKAPDLDEQEWFNARTGDTQMVPKGIDPGWANNPGFTRHKILEEYLAGRLMDLDPAIKATVVKDLTSNWLFKKMTEGEFYKFGTEVGTQFAAPIGVVPPEVAKAAGAKNGVVWLTPDGALTIGENKLSAETWAKATLTLDEGAVVRLKSTGDPGGFRGLVTPKTPDGFVAYRKIDGRYYRVEFMMQDRTFDDEVIKGGARLTIRSFIPLAAGTAQADIIAAREAGLLVKEETQTPLPPVPRRRRPGAPTSAPRQNPTPPPPKAPDDE